MRKSKTKPLLNIIALAAVFATLFPILWMMLLSIQTQRTALQMPPSLIFEPTLEAYRAVLSKAAFLHALGNSALIATLTTAICLGVGVMAAYSISRFRFKGSEGVLFGMLVTRIFPPVAMIVPYYLTLNAIGAHNTSGGLLLAYVALNTPMAVWMLKGYVDSVPVELEYCAMVDGATRWQAVRRITLPLLAPGLAATGIFIFVAAWNEFMFALILTGRESRTLPTVVAEFVGDTGVEWPQVMAASVVALAPILIATFALQKHIAGGMTAGAIKG